DNLLLGAGFVIEPINNAGILRKQGTSGTTTITNGVQLVNTGTLEVLSGTLYVNQAGANSPGIVNTGTITVGDGATLGGTIQDNSGAIVQGSGTLGVSPSVDRVTLPPTRD